MNNRPFHRVAIAACALVMLLGALAVFTGLPASVEGTKLPGTIVIDYIQKQYGAVTFDHEMHVGLAEGCGKCHHMHNEKVNATCRECHTLTVDKFKASANQGFLPCSGCHTDFSPDSPEMPGLKVAFHKACFQCHVGIGELGSSPQGCTKTCHTKK